MTNNTFPKASESFGKLPKASETPFRKENHTLTVRDVLKLFEEKNVDITERSIINYCHPNKHGVSLLDCFYDENERKYYITPESVEKAIEEVKARKIRLNQEQEGFPKASESFGNVPNDSENEPEKATKDRIKELEQKILDLKITNRGKDYFIQQLQEERVMLLGKVEDSARLIGKLETELRQLEAPKEAESQNENPATDITDNITDTENEGSTEGQVGETKSMFEGEGEPENPKENPKSDESKKDNWEI